MKVEQARLTPLDLLKIRKKVIKTPLKKNDRYNTEITYPKKILRLKTENQYHKSLINEAKNIKKKDKLIPTDKSIKAMYPRLTYQALVPKAKNQYQIKNSKNSLYNSVNHKRQITSSIEIPSPKKIEKQHKIKSNSLIQLHTPITVTQKDSLQTNLSNFLSIMESILLKTNYSDIIYEIKSYVLEDNSDINDLEMCFSDEQVRGQVKLLIYLERVVLLLVVESIITSKYRLIQSIFKAILQQYCKFYEILLCQLTNKSILHMVSNKTKTILSKNINIHSSFSLASLPQIKNHILTKIKQIIKNFKKIQGFVNQQLNSNLKTSNTNALYYSLLQFYSFRLIGADWSIWGIEFLETCPSPYLFHESRKKYTLLLDLDETLIHYKISTGEFVVRPHVFEFIQTLQPHFQIGIFTCSLQQYADSILTHLPHIPIRFYRQHAIKLGNEFVKDLSRVGRDLSSTILVDNIDRNFRLQKQNGIHVKSWYGDGSDDVLKSVMGELMGIVKESPANIRKSMHKRTFMGK